MTLIISSINREMAVQISDRRSTGSDGWVDNMNKTFLLTCADARVIVSFTGLASVPSADLNTFIWIGTEMMKALEPDYQIDPAIDRFSIAATEKFSELATKVDDRKRRLSVVFTGYKYEKRGPRGRIWLVSNFDALDEDEPSEFAYTQFTVTRMRATMGANSFSLAWVSGMDASISDKQIKHLRKIGLEGRERAIMRAGLKILAKAAESPASNNAISKECSSIELPSDQRQAATARYHPGDNNGREYLAGSLVANREQGVIFIPEVELSSGPFPARPA